MPSLSHATHPGEGPLVAPNSAPVKTRDRFETFLAVLTAPFLVVGYYAVVALVKLFGHGSE
jgi:hypothetical protein